MKDLVRNEKFWMAIFDMIVSTALFFIGKYLGDPALEDLTVIIVAIQPVVLMVIATMAYTEVKIKTALIASDASSREAIYDELFR